jgi:dihydropyrimidinase
MQTLLLNGTVVNHNGMFEADVLLENDRILRVKKGITPESNMKIVDAKGMYVCPGFIDTHTHFDLDTGSAVTADNFDTGSRAAILGGTTTVLDFATQERNGSLKEALQTWHQKARGSSCNYGFHMAIARWDEKTAAEMDDMSAAGVTSYKMYMVYNGLKVDDGQIYAALKEAKKHGALIAVHCENWEMLLRMCDEVKARGILGPEGHPLSRPAAVEAEAVARFMRIAELANAPAYVVHLSTEEGLIEAKRARARGQEVYLETCPQYLLLTDERYKDNDGAKFVMSPPLRKDSDREALWEGLENGDIQTIGTDHCSFTMAQKAMGKDDFTKIPNGGAGAAYRPRLLYTYGVLTGKITMEQMVKYLSKNAALLFGMEDRGEIKEGNMADVVLWDPNATVRITDDDHAHHCDNSPYAGFEVKGKAKHVFLNGVHAVCDGAIKQGNAGKYIARGRYQKPQ